MTATKCRTNRSILLASIVLAMLAIIGCLVTAAPVQARDLPLWKQPAVFNAAGKFCLYNKGVYNIRPNMQGNYWLTCADGHMVRITIKRSKLANMVAVATL